MYLIDTRKYDDCFLLAKILEKVDFTDEEKKKLFKHFEKPEVVDAVEVVRCKDCKFCTYEPCKDYENVYICNRTYWSRSDGGLLPNHYCAWGERKEDGTMSTL